MALALAQYGSFTGAIIYEGIANSGTPTRQHRWL